MPGDRLPRTVMGNSYVAFFILVFGSYLVFFGYDIGATGCCSVLAVAIVVEAVVIHDAWRRCSR